VVELIEHVSNETPSAVLALMGPWGSGKTSVLLFARRRFNSGGRWKVVEFNPWMVSDLPSLVQEFFTTLVAALPDDRKGKRLRRKKAGYARSVAPLTAPFKIFGIAADQALRSAGDLLAGDQSIDARRRELEEALREHGRPILLIADDLDRLHPDELTLIFKLVRLVGRLPNVYYLLAFDEQTVLDVLTSTELAGGDRPRALAYPEKMVQVRLDLPPVHPRLAGRLLDQLLDGLIAKHNVTLDDRAAYRLGHAYRTHLASYLHEPRQVKRYCAQIEALYPLLATEVDFVDFAIVTFFRTVHPGVAGLLASHKEELTKPTHEQRRDAWQARLCEAGVAEADLGPVLDLLGQLFLPSRAPSRGWSTGRASTRR
jgi:predicted KAP-like P-loop ATPase